MIAANTSYKQNGVPVSIPSGSYGIAHLTVHQYEYPKGHPCHTGLSSYRRIVARCRGCAMRTYLKDGMFVQELHIPTI